MVRFGMLALLIAPALALAHPFVFVIGSPVASQDFHFKTAPFVFRTQGCTETAQPKISAAAEGMINGERRSVPLKVVKGTKPGVYGVFREWPAGGVWIVNLEGTCGSANASALVPVGSNGFIRESTKLLAHPATDAEIEASLKAVAEGGSK